MNIYDENDELIAQVIGTTQTKAIGYLEESFGNLAKKDDGERLFWHLRDTGKLALDHRGYVLDAIDPDDWQKMVNQIIEATA